MSHSIIAPSSADMWECDGHMIMSAKKLFTPDNGADGEENTSASREGEAAHWYSAQTINGHLIRQGTVAPNGEVISDDIIDGCDTYIEWNRRMVAAAQIESQGVEERVDIHMVHEKCYGTVDRWMLLATKRLVVADLKFGHLFVDHHENKQLISYVFGLVQKLNLPISDEFLVDMYIIQPRCYRHTPVRRWTVSTKYLVDTFLAHMQQVAQRAVWVYENAYTMDVQYVQYKLTSKCRHCPGRLHCPAYVDLVHMASECAKGREFDHLLGHGALNLGHELMMLREVSDLLKSYINAIEGELEARYYRKEKLVGVEAFVKKGNLKWTIDDAAVVALLKAQGFDKAIKPPQPVTPTQAVNSGVPRAQVEALSVRPDTGLKFTKSGSRRAELAFQPEGIISDE